MCTSLYTERLDSDSEEEFTYSCDLQGCGSTGVPPFPTRSCSAEQNRDIRCGASLLPTLLLYKPIHKDDRDRMSDYLFSV
jgi:hypothetical protein